MSSATWYLRTQDETFGPETRDRLIDWARHGRIMPGQEVSDDNVIWRRVEDVPFLDMRFSIDLGDGNPHGPYNRVAAEALIASGKLPPTATIVESRAPFDAEVEPAAEPEPEPPRPAIREVRVEVPVEKIVEKIVEKEVRVEVPVEKIVVDETRVNALTAQVGELTDELAAARTECDKAKDSLAAVMRERAAAQLELERTKDQLAEVKALLASSEAMLAEKKTELADSEAATAAKSAELAARDADVAAKSAELAARDAALEKKNAELADKNAALAAEMARTSDFQSREAKLNEQISSLAAELNRLPQAAGEVADMQAACFKLLQDESADLENTLAREKEEFEEMKSRYMERSERLAERRREILKHAGCDPADMTRKALIERPEDPRTIQLRREYEHFRREHDKIVLDFKAQVRQLSEELHVCRAETRRAEESGRDIAQLNAENEQLRETLQRVQQDLIAERQKEETARQQQAASQQALMARLASLESPSIGTPGTLATNQSREAKMVKFPTWMRLKG